MFYALCAASVVVLFAFFSFNSFWVWIYLPVFEMVVAFIFPSYNTLMSDMVGKDSQGEVLGVSASVQSFAYGISPFLGGVFLGVNINIPIILGGVCMLAAAIVVKKIPEKEKDF